MADEELISRGAGFKMAGSEQQKKEESKEFDGAGRYFWSVEQRKQTGLLKQDIVESLYRAAYVTVASLKCILPRTDG